MSNDLSQRRQRRIADQITPNLWRIPLAGGTVNAYLLRSNGALTLVDCGYPGGGQRLASVIEAQGFSLEQLRRIVLTHSDLDHAGALRELVAMSDAEVLVHVWELDLVQGKTIRAWPKSFGGRLLARSYPLMIRHFRSQNGQQPSITTLQDGQLIDGWVAVHCPGHTPGHIALFQVNSGIMITGDALGWRGGRLAGPSPLYATDFVEASRSVSRLAELRPERLLFGHRAPIVDHSGQALSRLAEKLEREVAFAS